MAGMPGWSPAASGETVAITRAVLGRASFTTDRGQLELPAWEFGTASGGEFAWPALDESAFWRPSAAHLAAGPAAPSTATAAGTRLTVPIDPPRPRPGEPVYRYEATYVASSSAIAVGLRALPTGSRAPGSPTPGAVAGVCPHAAYYAPVEYSLTLPDALGNRVLIGPGGAPLPVTGA